MLVVEQHGEGVEPSPAANSINMESASVMPATQPSLYLPYAIGIARSLNVVVVDVACVSFEFSSRHLFYLCNISWTLNFLP